MLVVFGSINLDVVFPLADLPTAGVTVLGESYRLVPGGKGANQALAARRDGVEVRLIGAVGADAFAPLALAALRGDGVDLDGVRVVDEPTGCAAVLVAASGENQIAVASGANRTLTAEQLSDALLRPDTTLVVQMELPAAATVAAIERARQRGARVVWNFAPALRHAVERESLAAADVLVLNAGEAMVLADELGVGTPTAAALAKALGNSVVVTLGRDGAEFARPDAQWRIDALAVTPVDTTGAGDAFVGVLAAALDRGLDLASGVRRASVAAGLACLTMGAQTSLPRAAEIDRHLARIAPSKQL
jgi:ribokinase